MFRGLLLYSCCCCLRIQTASVLVVTALRIHSLAVVFLQSGSGSINSMNICKKNYANFYNVYTHNAAEQKKNVSSGSTGLAKGVERKKATVFMNNICEH